MLEENNILAFLMAILPVLIYSFMVYYVIPPTFIGNRRIRMYLVAGLLSPTLVYFFHFLFPYWSRPAPGSVVFSTAYDAIIQTSLVEEVAKLLTFFWVSSQRRNEKQDLPIATAYYAIMSASGFALIENVHYLMNFGDGVLFVRGITAIILHMVCGLIMGYFIAKSKMMPTSEEWRYNKKYDSKKLHQHLKIATGIILAIIVHGLYDLNLMLPDNTYSGMTLVIILSFGLTIGYFMVKELIRDSIEIRRTNMGVDIEKD